MRRLIFRPAERKQCPASTSQFAGRCLEFGTTSNGVACKSFMPVSALYLEMAQHSSMTECVVWQDELSGTCADTLIDESFKDEVRRLPTFLIE